MQQAGEWKAWFESRLVGSPAARALAHRMVVFRQGPGMAAERIHEETSTGRPRFALRADGRCCFSPPDLRGSTSREIRLASR